MLLDPDTLASIIPGAHSVEKLSDTHFRADVTLGVGPVKGRYKAEITLCDLDPPRAATLSGSVAGALGSGLGSGRVTLVPEEGGTTRVLPLRGGGRRQGRGGRRPAARTARPASSSAVSSRRWAARRPAGRREDFSRGCVA